MIKNVVLAFGTRPEATKMAPVYRALREVPGIDARVLLTGQHREQLADGLRLFGIRADENLDVMVDRQTLPELAARLLPRVAERLVAMKADYVLVHGDTLTTFVVAWAAFLQRIPVGHVEAGLRSGNMAEPFPEEANRRLTDVLTDLDLAPTPLAKRNLLAEGKAEERVLVTGQTAVDAIGIAAAVGTLPDGVGDGPYVTITMHRRENWPALPGLAAAIADVARSAPHLRFVYPVHLNPVVQDAVRPALEPVANVTLLPPLDYGPMAALLARSALIITDSGGLQEEGASLGVPVVVLRNVTERPEGVDAGIIRLAGNEPVHAKRIISELIHDEGALALMASAVNPYGDGRAGQRVAAAVAWRLGLAGRPAEWTPAARGRRELARV